MASSINKQNSFKLTTAEESYDVYRFQGESSLHDYYRFDLELISEKPLSVRDLLGQDAVFTIHASTEGDLVSKPKLEFSGSIISAGSQGQRGHDSHTLYLYRLEFASHIHRFGASRRYRFFLDKKGYEICQEVLGSNLEQQISTEGFAERELCTQYAESDLDFAKRIAAADACFFVNDYSSGGWILARGMSYKVEGQVGNSAVLEEKAQQVPSGMQGLHYDWRSPGIEFSEKQGQNSSDYQLYYHDIEKKEGLRQGGLSQRTSYEYQSQSLWSHGYAGSSEESDVREGLCYQIGGRGVLVTSIHYEGYEPEKLERVKSDADTAERTTGYYISRFSAIDEGRSYVAALIAKPQIDGLQTASVVSENGDEINADSTGSVRVRFHWDKESPHGICRIRVSSPWSGDGFGMQFLPRKGQEVAVGFIGGDIDRPVITGMLYNGSNRSPWHPSQEAWVSGIRTKSVPENSERSAYNELSFHDKLGQEKVVLHAERDLSVEVRGDLHSQVGGSSQSQVEGDVSESIVGDFEQKIGANASLSVRGDYSSNVGGDATETIEGDLVQTVEGKSAIVNSDALEQHVHKTMELIVSEDMKEIIEQELQMRVKGKTTEYYEGDLSQVVKGNSNEKVEGEQLRQYAKALHQVIGGSLKIDVTGEVLMTSGAGLTLMCGSNVFTINDSGISQASSQIATSSEEDKVDAEEVDAEDAEAPVYGGLKVTKVKAEKEEQEEPEELGNPVVFEIEELEISETTEDAETQTGTLSDVTEFQQKMVKWQCAFSDLEEPAEEMNWQDVAQEYIDLAEGKVEIPISEKNPHEYIHFRSYVSGAMAEGLAKTKLRYKLRELEIQELELPKLEEQKIQASAIIGPKDSPIGEQALTDAEKERVVWASIMLEAGEDKAPTTTDLQSMIDDFIAPITDWSQGADTEISGKYEEKQFDLYLHPATWEGNTAHLELGEQIHDDVELIQKNPEKFYFLKNKKAIKNNFYIFPLLINDIGSKEEPKREKLEESTFYWNDTAPEKRLAAATELAKCAITLENIGLSLPSFPEGFQWPVSTAASISGRFYDYRGGKTKFGINYIRRDKWQNDKVSGSNWTGDGLLKHSGTDVAIVAGTAVKAASKGIICYAQGSAAPAGTNPELGYQGFSVVINHGNGLYTHYAHLSKSKKFVLNGKTYSPTYPEGNSGLKVSAMIGLEVDAGETIGHVGSSEDYTYGIHLHFEVRYRTTEKEEASSADTTGYDYSSPEELYYLSPEYYR